MTVSNTHHGDVVLVPFPPKLPDVHAAQARRRRQRRPLQHRHGRGHHRPHHGPRARDASHRRLHCHGLDQRGPAGAEHSARPPDHLAFLALAAQAGNALSTRHGRPVPMAPPRHGAVAEALRPSTPLGTDIALLTSPPWAGHHPEIMLVRRGTRAYRPYG